MEDSGSGLSGTGTNTLWFHAVIRTHEIRITGIDRPVGTTNGVGQHFDNSLWDFDLLDGI